MQNESHYTLSSIPAIPDTIVAPEIVVTIPSTPAVEPSLADLFNLMATTMQQMAEKIKELEIKMYEQVAAGLQEAVDNGHLEDTIDDRVERYISNNFDIDDHVDIDCRIADYIRDNLNISFDI